MIRERARVVVAAALLIASAAWGTDALFPALNDLRGRTLTAMTFPPEDERVAPAAYIDLSTSYFLEARARIPESHSYAAVVGPRFASDVIEPEGVVPAFAQFALLPRRQVPPDEAEWLLCYGCFPADVTGGYDPAWRRFEPVWSELGELTIARSRHG